MRGDAVNPATSAEFAVVVGVLTYAAHRWHPELELGDLLLLAAGVCIAYFGLRLLLDRLVRGRPSPPKIVLEHQQLIGLRVAIERTTALPLLASLGQTQGAADVAAVAKACIRCTSRILPAQDRGVQDGAHDRRGDVDQAGGGVAGERTALDAVQ